MSNVSIQQFFKQFPNDDACLKHIFNIRFGQGHTCPKCGRKAKWYKLKSERAYNCQWCGHHIHPTVGTPFERSSTSLQLWFYAIYLFSTSRHGVPAKELQRQLGVTYKTAWRMGHEIRKHMARVDGENYLGGAVEVDETYVGGKVKNGKRGRGADNKTIVFGMMERNGDVITKIVPDARGKTLKPEIEKNVQKGTTILSDEWKAYNNLDKLGYGHQTVNHGARQYVDGETHVNSVEGFWARLKLSIRGSHIHVSGKHLGKYAKEFEYRFNSRKNPERMFPELISTYPEPLIG